MGDIRGVRVMIGSRVGGSLVAVGGMDVAVGSFVGTDVLVIPEVNVAAGFSGILVCSGTSMIVFVATTFLTTVVAIAIGSFKPSAPETFKSCGLDFTCKVAEDLRVSAVAVRSNWLEYAGAQEDRIREIRIMPEAERLP